MKKRFTISFGSWLSRAHFWPSSASNLADMYHLDREAAGWTEEKCYPEGYVHEYEKIRILENFRNEKIFTNDKFFLAMTTLGVIGTVLSTVYYSVPTWDDFDLTSAIFLLFEAVCLISLYISYQKHSKNVMKGMIGALLSAMLLDSVCWLDTDFGLDTVFSCVLIVLNIILFSNHFIINKEHHSKPLNIHINQFLVLIIGAVYIIWDVIWAINYPDGANIFGAIVECVHCIGVTVTVVCVESRLDAYRLDREAAGWTEEKGYPEGYVHEYEKTK